VSDRHLGTLADVRPSRDGPVGGRWKSRPLESSSSATIRPECASAPHGANMFDMVRPLIALTCCMACSFLWASDHQSLHYPFFDYGTAKTHEIEPHRRTIPLTGVRGGFNQLRLTLIVSAAGDVSDAEAGGSPDVLKYWPQLQGEVRAWKFVPFKKHGKPVIAQAEEYIDLVPPERLPNVHVAAPSIGPESKITIVLKRGACYGTCPSYDVAVSTGGIEFDGKYCVAALGKHTATVDDDEVRKLARKFVVADFYSMDNEYEATVTDLPAYVLSINIDGQRKEVMDYVGRWVGMPTIIRELEDDVDSLAQTRRWVQGKSPSAKRACMAQH
jgi:Domain of unknown function (DUF6438)